MVATPSLLKKVVNLGVRVRDPEDLTGRFQPFFLVRHTSAHRKNAVTAAEQYSTVVGGGAVPSLEEIDFLSEPYGVSLQENFLQAQGYIT